MARELEYDYRELAFDNYQEADALLRKLVEMRKFRHMTQAQLADEMNVTQGYISQIENGYTGLLDLVNDYAIEVGARISYHVEKAELMPRGRRYERYVLNMVRPVPSESSSLSMGGVTQELGRGTTWKA